MTEPILTTLDIRVPQPGMEKDYGVPAYLVKAAAVLYQCRNKASDIDVDGIDKAILRLYRPYIQQKE